MVATTPEEDSIHPRATRAGQARGEQAHEGRERAIETARAVAKGLKSSSEEHRAQRASMTQ